MSKRIAVVSTGSWDANFAVESKDAVALIDIIEKSNRVSIEYVGGSSYAVIKPSSEGCSMRMLEVITKEVYEKMKLAYEVAQKEE